MNGAQLSLSFPSPSREVVEVQNQYLEVTKGCLRMSKLKFNPDKLEVLLKGVGVMLIWHWYVWGYTLFRACHLGMPLDSSMFLDEYLTGEARGAFYQLRLVCHSHTLKGNVTLL